MKRYVAAWMVALALGVGFGRAAVLGQGGDTHPLIVGKESVQRYMTIVGECAKAGALMAK